jgi:DNA-binding MarR family transcriptional regulator
MTIDEIIQANTPLPLEKKVLLNLLYTQQTLHEALGEVFKSFDISGEQFNVLRILRGQKGPANMFAIQQRMLARTSNTTRLVDKLVAKGLVTRKVCPDNRRKMEVCITGDGLALLEDLDPKLEAREKAFTEKLSAAELQTFNALLEKFRNQ